MSYNIPSDFTPEQITFFHSLPKQQKEWVTSPVELRMPMKFNVSYARMKIESLMQNPPVPLKPSIVESMGEAVQ